MMLNQAAAAAMLALPLLVPTGEPVEADTRSALVPYTAVSIGPLPQLHLGPPGAAVTCDSMEATGYRDDVTMMPVSMDTSQWHDCQIPLGIEFTIEPTHPWSINFSGPPGTVTEGYIGGMVAVASAADDPALCSFAITGEAYTTFDKSEQTLNVLHNETNAGNVDNPLTISNVTGCFGLISDGDPAYFETTLQLDP